MPFNKDGTMKTITLALTGASGLPYGMRLLECLLQGGQRVHLIYSQAAQIVAKQELGVTLPSRPQDAEQFFNERFGKFSGELKVFGIQDWYAPMASGSNPGDAMVVCPCTMGTLATGEQAFEQAHAVGQAGGASEC